MVKPTREIIHSLHNQGKTFADIGRTFKVSRQRIHAIYTGYSSVIKNSEKYRMYKRHQMHDSQTKLAKPCDYCVNVQFVNPLS